MNNYTWWCWRHQQQLVVVISLLVVSIVLPLARPQRQTNLLQKGGSQYNATNLSSFFKNQNATFIDLRNQLSNGNTHFATAQQARSGDPVYGMAQCRNYMSTPDCLACFDASVTLIRNYSAANGARVIYDGCFLRYESNSFYDQSTLPGNVGICGNQTASQPTAFDAAAEGLLSDLQAATPRINGYFAASTRAVLGGTTSIYGIAQCAETLTQSGCQDCLTVANANIRSCPPDTDGRAIDAGCFLRYSETSFFPSDKMTDIASFLRGGGGSSNRKAIIGGVVGGVGVLVIILGFLIWYSLSRKSKAAQRGKILGATELQGPLNYSYSDLKSATKGFSEEYKLGEGGFGEVFKGIFKDGNIVAVKKLAIASTRAIVEFESEVRVISNVHHRNLIRLLGCCSKGPELLLVLEYMKHGSLDKYLYGEKRGTLNWKQRFDIIFGTARGLAYLHEQYHVTIIHRDIKSSNILLDDEFQPKIADFGLARLLPEDHSHVSTRFAGTLGYTAPEYALNGQLSEKVDTYSFGVVILEIISGRRCTEVQSDPLSEHLLEHAWNLYENGMHLKLVDETLDSSEYREEDVKKILEIGLMCTQSPVSLRPSMSEVVVLLLSNRSVEQRPPSRPAFVDSSSDLKFRVDGSTTTASSKTNATDTITDITGR